MNRELNSNTKSAALEYLRDKWLTPADDEPKWTSFETVENDLLEIEEKNLVTIDAIAAWRAFFDDRKRDLEIGRLVV